MNKTLDEKALERACKIHNVGWSMWKEPQQSTARQVMSSAIRAYFESAKAGESKAVIVARKVKELEWEEVHDRRSDEDPSTEWNGEYEAESVLGTYKISMGFGSDCYYWSVTDPFCIEIGNNFEDPNYAKASAQSDYEKRILSVLVDDPSLPALQADNERLREENERLRTFAESFRFSVNEDAFYKDVSLHLISPHSLGIRLHNDSSKSWLFKDVETRRLAALAGQEKQG